MVSDLMRLAHRPVVRDLLITAGGRGVQLGLGLIGNIISARTLGPVDFGRFGLLMAAINICGTLGDAGLTYAAIKFVAQERTQDPDRALAFGRAYFLLRLGAGLVVAALGILLAGPIAGWVLGAPALTPYLQLGFLTLGSLGLSSYPNMVLVGLAQFGRMGVVGVLNALITVGGIALLAGAGRLDLGTLVGWNVVLPLASTLPTRWLLPAAWLPWRWPRTRPGLLPAPGVLRELLGFSKWMGLSLLGSVISGQADVVLLGRLAGPGAVGVYSVALSLAARLDAVNQSLITVLVPRASRLTGRAALQGYMRRVLVGSLALAGALGAATLLAQPAIALLYGARYAGAAGLFLALLAVVLFDLVTSAVLLVAFPLNRPRVLAIADWLRVAVLGVSGWLLIPAYGAFGAVGARLLARVSGTGATLWRLHQAAREAAPGESPAVVD